jgi:hypothetical protein
MSVVTIAEVKALGRISTSSQDTLLQDLIDSAESFVEEYCDISLTSEEVTESLDGGSYYLRVSRKPMTVVSSVIDTDDDTVLDSDDYKNVAFGLFQADETQWGQGLQRYETTYTGGWAEVPPGLKLAIRQLVLRAYANFEAQDNRDESDKKVSWQSLWEGSDITAYLEQYSLKPVLD